jgi:hypothetical protein
MVRLVIDLGELIKLVLRRGVGKRVGGWGKLYGGCLVLCPLCVFGCNSVVLEGVYVRN